jgi:hypothetical protein
MPGADQVKIKTTISYIAQRRNLWIKTLSLINKIYFMGLYNINAEDFTQDSGFKTRFVMLVSIIKSGSFNLNNFWTADDLCHNFYSDYRKEACEYSKRRYGDGPRFIFWGQCLPRGIRPPNRARKLSALG